MCKIRGKTIFAWKVGRGWAHSNTAKSYPGRRNTNGFFIIWLRRNIVCCENMKFWKSQLNVPACKNCEGMELIWNSCVLMRQHQPAMKCISCCSHYWCCVAWKVCGCPCHTCAQCSLVNKEVGGEWDVYLTEPPQRRKTSGSISEYDDTFSKTILIVLII